MHRARTSPTWLAAADPHPCPPLRALQAKREEKLRAAAEKLAKREAAKKLKFARRH